MTEFPRRVVLENELARITILPELGGKIASIFLKRNQLEALQQPLQPYRQRIWAQDFADSDASGWDECLPTVSACEVSVGQETKEIPDHGDIWLLPATCSATATEVHLETTLASMPLRLRRRIHLDGNTMRVHYEVRNQAVTPLSYLWSAHPLFAVDAADGIVLPKSVATICVEGSANARLGNRGDQNTWPVANDSQGKPVDLRIVQLPQTAIADKLFAGPLTQGYAGLYRAAHCVGILVQFDPQELPYLGLWLCYGGWPEGKVSRQQAVALEPCMAPSDSLADALLSGAAHTLAPGETSTWQIACKFLGVDEVPSFERFAEICSLNDTFME